LRTNTDRERGSYRRGTAAKPALVPTGSYIYIKPELTGWLRGVGAAGAPELKRVSIDPSGWGGEGRGIKWE